MIALQLYTLRDALKTDFAGTIRRVADIGYPAVEAAGEYGGTPAQAKMRFDSLGLQISSAHGVLHNGETAPQILDLLGALGINTFVCAWGDREHFHSLDAIQKFCERINEVDQGLQAHGARIAYHNHDHELHPLPDGSLPFVRMMDYLNPSVIFEVDTYWVQVGGANVIEVLKQFGSRAPILHIKDGSTRLGDAKTAVGDGAMDFPPILAAHDADWLIVELDDCDTDMMTAVERSFAYLSRLTAQNAQGS